MLADTWMKEMDVKCQEIVDAFAAMYAHVDTLVDEADNLTDDEVQEVLAVVAVKIDRTHKRIAEAAEGLPPTVAEPDTAGCRAVTN